MLLTITCTATGTTGTTDAPGMTDATDLGYLLHKRPGGLQSFELPVGTAHVFYPRVSADRCTAALMLEVDPVALVRDRRFSGDAFALAQYVNDRPYASSSMLAVALGKVFRTALAGRSSERPDLARAALPLVIEVASVPCRGDRDLVSRLFEPLGWEVSLERLPLDPEFPGWGDSPYAHLRLTGTLRLADALRQLYVMLPVLDDAKHYWVSDDEVGKLLRAGEGWLADHPERDLITERYLAHQRSIVADATTRLRDASEADGSEPESESESERAAPDRPTPLRLERLETVLELLRELGARTVGDLGCGEGALLVPLDRDADVERIVGADVSVRALERAGRRLRLAELSDARRERIRLIQSSVTYEDDRIAGLDAVVLMEVVEHLDAERLPALEASVFRAAHPGAVIVTTPNSEHNARYALAEGALRHPDHRFEFTRDEFTSWAGGVAERTGYSVELRPVGPSDAEVGPPTQLALFRREPA